MDNNTSSEWKTPETIWNPMFLGAFLSSAMMGLSQQMSNSNLSLYAKSLNAPAEQIGQLMSMFAVTAFFFRFISGPAMRAFNKKKLLLGAMAVFSLAYFGFSFSPVIAEATGADTILVMKMFRLIQGIGNAFGNSCCMTIVSDFIPKKSFTSGMSWFALGQTIAQAIGPRIGTGISARFGFQTTYIIVGCCMVVTLAVAFLSIKNAPRKTVKFMLKFNDMIAKESLIPAFTSFLIAIGFTSISSFLLVYAAERGIKETDASLYFTISAIALLVTRPVVGRLTDRYGFVRVGVCAIVITSVSLIIIGFSGSLAMLLTAAVINSFGYGAAQPALQSLCVKAVSPERRGSGSATYYIGYDAGTIIGPIVCGKVAGQFGYSPVMWCAVAIPVVLGAVVVLVFRKRINSIEEEFLHRSKA